MQVQEEQQENNLFLNNNCWKKTGREAGAPLQGPALTAGHGVVESPEPGMAAARSSAGRIRAADLGWAGPGSGRRVQAESARASPGAVA